LKEITFEEFLKLEPLITKDTLVEHYDMYSRWFEAEIRFKMDQLNLGKVLKHLLGVNIEVDGKPVELNTRPDWDEYFLGIAEAVSKRGDCSRRQVGAVVVDMDQRIVSTGYNGAEPGGPSCLKGECPRAKSDVPPGSSYDTGPGACIATHAEANALLYAGRDGTQGSKLYLTEKPCLGCEKLIKAAGIYVVIWPQNTWYVG